ncbi:MAG: hypothetical protein HDT28_03985 [Clostridiales bacterium]|nr:hypothetical protein [Clostridiales bacterium]
MYQITVSVNDMNADWLYSVDEIIGNKLKNCMAVSALSVVGRRLYCSFGCESAERAQMVATIKEYIVELFGVAGKFEFIKRNLMLGLPKQNYELLLHTLVAFDRENEHKLLNKLIRVEDGMALDGIFNFRLGELRERWIEICNLTRNNGAYLYDDETYNELLRFLISAVNPKINKLTVCEKNGKYRVTGSLKNSVLDFDVAGSAELMYHLIDLAPLELVIDGRITNRELFNRLEGIFDAKTLDTAKNKTKK